MAANADPVVALVLNPQVVIAFFGVLVAAFGTLTGLIVRNGHKTKQNAATTNEIRKAVVNSHSVNLRDDLDEKFNGLASLVKEGFAHTAAETMEVRKEIGGVRAEQRELRKNLETERDRIRELEDTRPTAPIVRKATTRRGPRPPHTA
jgi:Protein of unknown function (DUF2746)